MPVFANTTVVGESPFSPFVFQISEEHAQGDEVVVLGGFFELSVPVQGEAEGVYELFVDLFRVGHLHEGCELGEVAIIVLHGFQ